MGDDNQVQQGDNVKRTKEVLEVPVGKALLVAKLMLLVALLMVKAILQAKSTDISR